MVCMSEKRGNFTHEEVQAKVQSQKKKGDGQATYQLPGWALLSAGDIDGVLYVTHPISSGFHGLLPLGDQFRCCAFEWQSFFTLQGMSKSHAGSQHRIEKGFA